jgi:hypothetical protein
MMKNTPLQIVNEMFGTKGELDDVSHEEKQKIQKSNKEQLVAKVIELIGNTKEEKQRLQKSLQFQTNKKLLRLYKVGNAVKEQFGTKEKLVDNIVKLQSKVTDLPYKNKLLTFSLPKLMDLFRVSEKKSGELDE